MTEGPNLQWEKQIKSIKAVIPPRGGGEKGRADEGLHRYSLSRAWQWPYLDRNWGWAPEFVKTRPEGFCISVQSLLQRGEQAAALLLVLKLMLNYSEERFTDPHDLLPNTRKDRRVE